ncbi:uncharacterized protein TEOVI_000410900 [Trypanosoma equiperdum]|uniref:Uncharacterized protein n=1 Tax=Trypanosoma equiperdum TaxID=5694 RepID=A0A1G4IJJ9_TRYEQ|nr:hypothetical protein, conserved [Trypanosoma equiperdum]
MGNCLCCRDKHKHEPEPEVVMDVMDVKEKQEIGHHNKTQVSTPPTCQSDYPPPSGLPTSPPDDTQSSVSPRDNVQFATAPPDDSSNAASPRYDEQPVTTLSHDVVSSTPPRVETPPTSSPREEVTDVVPAIEEFTPAVSLGEEVVVSEASPAENPFTASPHDDTTATGSRGDNPFTASRDNAEYDFSPREDVNHPPQDKPEVVLAYDFSAPVASVYKNAAVWTFTAPKEEKSGNRVVGFASAERGPRGDVPPSTERVSEKPSGRADEDFDTDETTTGRSSKPVDAADDRAPKLRAPLLAPPVDDTVMESEEAAEEREAQVFTEAAKEGNESVGKEPPGGEGDTYQVSDAVELGDAMESTNEPEVKEIGQADVEKLKGAGTPEKADDEEESPRTSGRRDNNVLSPLLEDKAPAVLAVAGENNDETNAFVHSAERALEQSKVGKDSEENSELEGEHPSEEGLGDVSYANTAGDLPESVAYTTHSSAELQTRKTEGSHAITDGETVRKSDSNDNALAGIIRRQRDMERRSSTGVLLPTQSDALGFLETHSSGVAEHDLVNTGVEGEDNTDGKMQYLQGELSLDFGGLETFNADNMSENRVHSWSSVESNGGAEDRGERGASRLNNEGNDRTVGGCVDSGSSDGGSERRRLADIVQPKDWGREIHEEEEVTEKYSVEEVVADKEKSAEDRVSYNEDFGVNRSNELFNGREAFFQDEKTESKSRSTSVPYRTIPIISPPLATPQNREDGDESLM